MGRGRGAAEDSLSRSPSHLNVTDTPSTEETLSRRSVAAKDSSAPVKKCALDTATENLPSKKEIRESIPKQCFEHSYSAALYELARDVTIVVAFAAIALCTLRTSDMRLIDWVGWAMYAYWQGSAFTGLWVLAHECGHGGFSASKNLNDSVGLVLHSALLVPYFSWQFSHAKHHKNTNHLIDGESHNPDTMANLRDMLGLDYVKMHEMIGDDAFAVWQLFAHLVFGWPVYLITNATGGRKAHGRKEITSTLDHFRPSSALFPPSWYNRVALSSAGVAATIAALVLAGQVFGGAKVALLYAPAYMVCNGWLVLYTWLQHTREDIAHYGDDEWSWVKGALSTIDRPYSECFGFHDWMHHRIGSTHIFHHLFSDAPCYKAVEATKHLKAFLEPKGLYNYDGRPILTAAWQTAKRCHYVEGTTGAQYFKSLKDKK